MSLSRDDEDDDDDEELIHSNLKAPEELPNKGDESEEDAPVFNDAVWSELANRWGEKMATVVEDKVLDKCPPEVAYWAVSRIRSISQDAILRTEFIDEVELILKECEKQVRGKGGADDANMRLIGQMQEAFGRGDKVAGPRLVEGQFVRITSTRPKDTKQEPRWSDGMDDFTGLVGVVREYVNGFPSVTVMVDGQQRTARFNEEWLSAAEMPAPPTYDISGEMTEAQVQAAESLVNVRQNYFRLSKKKKNQEFHKFLAAEQTLEAQVPVGVRGFNSVTKMHEDVNIKPGQTKLPTKRGRKYDEERHMKLVMEQRGSGQQMAAQDYAPVPLATLKPNLTNLLQMSQDGVERFIQEAIPGIQKYDKFLYRPGDIPIMILAHMDTVCREPPGNLFFDGQRLWANGCLGADDRAGVYAVLKILEKGLRPHVMFTRDEEIGNIGASAAAHQLKAPEGIRYIIELDRKGVQDAVFYQDVNKEFHKYITDQTGYPEARGSMSDISEICPAWGVAGVNLSIGFENEHRDNEILDVKAMHRTIDKVASLLTVPVFPDVYKYEAVQWTTPAYRYYDEGDFGQGFGGGAPYSWQQEMWGGAGTMRTGTAVPGQNLPVKSVNLKKGDRVKVVRVMGNSADDRVSMVGKEFVVERAKDGLIKLAGGMPHTYWYPEELEIVKRK